MAAAKAYIGGVDSGAKDETIAAAIRDHLHQCKSIELFKKVRAITSAPIGIVPSPLRLKKHPWTRCRVLRGGDLDRLSGLYERAVKDVAKEMGFVPFLQPKETQVDGLRTKAAYSLDRTATRGDADDISHMNVEFGTLVLTEVLENQDFMEGPG